MTNGRIVSVMRPDLELALRERVTGRAELRFDTSVTAVDDGTDAVRVTLADGGTLDADLLVGADGIHSTVRRQVFGEEGRYLRYLGLHTAAFLFADPDVHAELGGRFCLTDTVGRQMGWYALRDGRVAVFTVHRTPDPALPSDPRAELRRVYDSLGWLAPRALARCPEPEQVYYDQVAQTEVPRWSRGRVVLLGDACYAVSLLAGQGASLAIGGAHLLADRLAGESTVAAALAAYEHRWRPLVTDRQRRARGGIEWFLPTSALRLRTRRLVLKLTNVPVLSRYFAGALVGKSTVPVGTAGAGSQSEPLRRG